MCCDAVEGAEDRPMLALAMSTHKRLALTL